MLGIRYYHVCVPYGKGMESASYEAEIKQIRSAKSQIGMQRVSRSVNEFLLVEEAVADNKAGQRTPQRHKQDIGIYPMNDPK
jgi:hypothetical protein